MNDKIYIGSADHIYSRWSCHKSQLKKQKHHSAYLQRAVNKYGIENFVFEIIEECEIEILIEREQYFLDTLNPQYNVNPIADSRRGAKLNEEQRKRNSERQKGSKGYWYGKVGPSKGVKESEEDKKKRRESIISAYRNPEVKERFRERMKLWVG